jgi:hypothetical protein
MPSSSIKVAFKARCAPCYYDEATIGLFLLTALISHRRPALGLVDGVPAVEAKAKPVKSPLRPSPLCGGSREVIVKIELAAIVAEIARRMDRDLLAFNPAFSILSRPHRMSLIMTCLQRENVASARKSINGVVLSWDLSQTWQEYLSAQSAGIMDEIEDIECPAGIFSAADELSRILRTRSYLVEEITSSVVQRFQMCESGILDYCGRKAGLCVFRKSQRCIELMNKNAEFREAIERDCDSSDR